MTAEPLTIWQKLELTSIGDFMATSGWAFPTVETIHVIALVTVIGTIAIMDMRMLGWASKATPVTVVSNDTLKITWGAFVLAAITGLLMFVSKASSYMINPYFLGKMCVLVLAGLNMLFFHFVTWKNVKIWDSAAEIPPMVKLAGITSLFFWVVIVFLGRVIGFTLGMYY